MDMIVTTAGRQALVNAQQTGTASVVINKIGVGTGKYTATASQTALVSETKRLPIVEGGSAGDNAIHVAYQDAGSDAYAVHEIGLFLEDGTLFAVTSQTTAILQKTATSTALIVLDIVFADVNVSSITFGDVTFSNPAASASNAGVVVLATDDEVAAGTNTQKVVTPASLLKRTATASRIGLVELATDDEAKAGTDASRAVTPAAVKAAIDTRAATSADTISGTKTSAFVTPAGLKSLTSTTARSGLIELATEAEATSGTDTSRAVTPATAKAAIDARIASSTDTIAGTSATTFVTPSGLKTLTSTTDRAGLIEIATDAEVTAGTDTARAVTPAGLLKRTGTASRIGLVELATNDETLTGTDAVRAVTPAGVKAAIDARAATSAETIAGTLATSFVTPAGLKTLTATTARAGLVELATNAETTAGTDSLRAVTPAGLKAMFRTVEITDNSNIVNTEGNGNISFYPSATSSFTQARAGTSQMAVARFSDGESGPSMVFYKSRGSSIKSSKSVLPGDNVGMITFLADNGNIDYTGSSIGARVAFIYADVFENSTVTASGTKNLGIRGALRFYVCSDSADRTGTGVELIDNSFRPTSDSVMQLGTAGRRFTNIYATNGTINTSDEREKTDIKPIDNTVLDVWSRVNFCEYRLKTGDRVHIGVIAQRVAEAFHAEGLDAHDYGLFCEDTDEDGVVRLGIRYTEALALECALQRRETERLKERLNALEKGAD
jgi:hypothetical protein